MASPSDMLYGSASASPHWNLTSVNRKEFETLRDIPDKRIVEDVIFGVTEPTSPVMSFDNVKVENSLGIELRLNGKFNPLLPSVVFNFRVRGVGPICRVDVNGTMHKGSRTHKHALANEDDPRQNLPTDVTPRPDLNGKSPREIWQILLRQANIERVGRFVDPT
jgi:hypothetical protein